MDSTGKIGRITVSKEAKHLDPRSQRGDDEIRHLGQQCAAKPARLDRLMPAIQEQVAARARRSPSGIHLEALKGGQEYLVAVVPAGDPLLPGIGVRLAKPIPGFLVHDR